MPSFENGLVTRTCYVDYSNYSFGTENSYTEFGQDFIVTISPVEVLNCTTGQVRLYKQFNYSIDYIARSPLLIKSIIAPLKVPAGDLMHIQIELLPIGIQTQNATIQVFQNNQLLAEKEITTQDIQVNATFYSPQKEGLQGYSVELVIDNQTMDNNEFSTYVSIVEPLATFPTTIGLNPTINLSFYNYLNSSVNLSVEYFLTHGTTGVSNGSFDLQLSPGENMQSLSFTGLTREVQSYTLTLELSYLDEYRSVSYTLTTNNVPLLYLSYEPVVYENDLINISYVTEDYDQDPVTVSINNPIFTATQETFLWQTNYQNAGNYTLVVTASDGYINTTKSITVEIRDRLEPMELNGTVNYLYPTPQNGAVHAWVNTTSIATTLMTRSSFTLTLQSDLPQTYVREGANPNETIHIRVDGFLAAPNITWQSGTTILETFAANNDYPPVWGTNNPIIVDEDTPIPTTPLNVSEQNGQSLIFTFHTNPLGCWITNTNLACPQQPQNTFGNYSLIIEASDGITPVNATLDADILSVNDPPFLASFSLQSVVRNATLQIVANASDVENDTLMLSINSTAWSIFNLTLFWTPTLQDIGLHGFMVTISDGTNATSGLLEVDVLGIRAMNIAEPGILYNPNANLLFATSIQNTGDLPLNVTTFTVLIDQWQGASQQSTDIAANQALIVLVQPPLVIEHNPSVAVDADAEGIGAQISQVLQIVNLSVTGVVVGESAGSSVLEEYTVHHAGLPLSNLTAVFAQTQAEPLPVSNAGIIFFVERVFSWPQDVAISHRFESQSQVLASGTLSYHFRLDPAASLHALALVGINNNTALLETGIANLGNDSLTNYSFLLTTNLSLYPNQLQQQIPANTSIILLADTPLGQNGTYHYAISLIKQSQVVDIRQTSYNATTTLSPPELVAAWPSAGAEGQLLAVQVMAYSPDNRTVHVNFTPPLNNSGEWLPSFEQSGNYTTDIVLHDGIFAVHNPFNITIANTNRPPGINSTMYPKAMQHVWYEATITAQDPDNVNNVSNDDTPVAYQLVQGPQNMTMGVAGYITWEVNMPLWSMHDVWVRAVDSLGLADDRHFNISVIPAVRTRPGGIST